MNDRQDKWLDGIELPACLSTRANWSQFLSLRRPPEPHVHQIEPTNVCPHRCIMCPRSKMTRESGFMEFTLYTKVIDEVATYSQAVRDKEIELFHFGESLLHPELPRMIAYASQRGLRITLSVNPAFLKEDLAESILASKPYRLIASLDGYDVESYRAMRGPTADFERAVHNVETLIDLCRRCRSQTRASVRMIVMHANKHQADHFVRDWQTRGVDAELREFFPWGEPEMASMGHYKRFPSGMPCPFPWQYLVVQWNGDVVGCCRDYNGVNRLGNVGHASLRQIWNSSRYEAFREQMATGHYDNPICGPCLSLYYTSGSDEQNLAPPCRPPSDVPIDKPSLIKSQTHVHQQSQERQPQDHDEVGQPEWKDLA